MLKPKTGATDHYNAQLGLPDIGGAIKWLVVCGMFGNIIIHFSRYTKAKDKTSHYITLLFSIVSFCEYKTPCGCIKVKNKGGSNYVLI